VLWLILAFSGGNVPDTHPIKENKINGADILLQVAREQGLDRCPVLYTQQETVTYGDLDRRSCQYGQALRALGIEAQDRVLLLVDDRPEMYYTYLGAMKIGAVPVALNLRISAKELAFIIADSDCTAIVIDLDYFELCQSACTGLKAAPIVVGSTGVMGDVKCLDALAASESGNLTSVLLDPDAMALWMYTSGTTGTSKGAVHVLNSIKDVGRYLGPIYGVGPGDKIFCSSKLFFAFSLGHVFLAALRLGAAVILHTGWPSPEAIADVVERHCPDVMFSVPTMYRGLLSEGHAANSGFQSIRHFISAGEHLPTRVFDEWHAVTGVPILAGIGATETLMMFIANYPETFHSGATGTPLPGTDVRLQSDDGAVIDQAGIPGVLWVRSNSLAIGYWRQSDKTAAVFKNGWYCTGDVFVRDQDGQYFYQARDDDMLKVSGQWVSPQEIDECVLQSPGVSEAATIGVENDQGLIRLMLCLITEDPDVDRQELQAELTKRMTGNLSVYKCPRRFIYLDEMPKTATGKIQRFKLRQIAADQTGQST